MIVTLAPDIAAAYLGLGNTTLAQRNIQATLYADRLSELQTHYQAALRYYQKTAGAADPDARKIQAFLEQQQSLLGGSPSNSPQWRQAQALSAQIQFQLALLPVSHTSLYAHIHFAENLIKLGGEVNSEVVQLLDTAAKQAESLGDFQIQSYVLWRKFDQQALHFYRQAAAVNVPASNVQARLNQQSLLLDGTDIDPLQQVQAQALSAPIQAQLDRLPLSHATLYARIHFAHADG